MRIRVWLAGILFVATAALPLVMAAPAEAESGAHTSRPGSPVQVEVPIEERG